MPDLTELPDLAGDVRARAVPPPYDEVGRRVRSRRRRAAAGVLAVTVLVVGGAGVAQSLGGLDDSSKPGPTGHGTLPRTDRALWRAVVDGTESHPFEVSGSDDGAVAVVWRALEPGSPTFALVIREPDGTLHGTRLDEPVDLTPVPGGWVATRTARAWLVGPDGSWRDLGAPGRARASRPGDVVVPGPYGDLLYAPGDGTLSSASFEPPADSAVVTLGGHPVTCAGTDGTVRVSGSGPGGDGPAAAGATCVVKEGGGTVAVAVLGDGADGSIPLLALLVSTDGGGTWDRLPAPDLGSMTSMAVATSGTTVVTGDEGRAVVVSPSGSVLEPGVQLGVVFAAGDRLYALSHALSKGPLLVSDDGTTWQSTTLPGMESSGG